MSVLQADAPSAPAYWRSRYGHISNTPTWDEGGESEVIISFEKGNTKALGLFAKIFDLICRQASGREGADRC